MNKIKLIIGREYLTRVKSKSFILVTLLVPFFIFLFMGVTGYITSYKSSTKDNFVLIDPNNILTNEFAIKNINLELSSKGLEKELASYDEKKHKGIIVLAPLDSLSNDAHLKIYSDKTIPIEVSQKLKRKIRSKIKEQKLAQANLSTETLNSLNVKVDLTQEGIKDLDTKKSSMLSGAALGIGYFMGMLMYFFIFLYGTMVMKSVMEEKTNRIIEVIISSVSPTQLMVGKILGVGFVALTQIVVWGVMMFGIQLAMISIFGVQVDAADVSNLPKGNSAEISELINVIGSINWLLIFPMFILFFFGGYLLYAAFFAAIGAAVSDASGDQQTMTLPISIPIIMAMFLMMSAVRAPDSTLALFSSIFPLFSPIVMPSLTPFDPPIWQMAISLIILYGTAYFFIWLAGRIYRVGILLYGKKIKPMEMMKWLFKAKI